MDEEKGCMIPIEVEKSKDSKSQVIQVIFLIVLVIAIGALIYASISIVRYHDLLMNPLGYNIKQFGINSCLCWKNGEPIFINQTGGAI